MGTVFCTADGDPDTRDHDQGPFNQDSETLQVGKQVEVKDDENAYA